MNIDYENIAAIHSLGYTPDEARFLYIVAMHSGYFVPRQFLVSTGAKWGKRSNTLRREARKPRPCHLAGVSRIGWRLSSLFKNALPPDRP